MINVKIKSPSKNYCYSENNIPCHMWKPNEEFCMLFKSEIVHGKRCESCIKSETDTYRNEYLRIKIRQRRGCIKELAKHMQTSIQNVTSMQKGETGISVREYKKMMEFFNDEQQNFETKWR